MRGSINGAGRSHWTWRGAVGELDLDLVGVGPGGRHDDVVGPDEVLDPLVLDLGVDLVAVDVGIAVDLVEDEDDRLLGLAERAQGFDFGALHVAGDDEEDEIGVAGDVAGEGLADLAADLVDARRVDHDELGSFESGPVGCVVLPALGGAIDGRAVGGAHLEDVLAHEGVQDRRLAPADHAERGDLDRRFIELLAELAQLRELAGQDGFFFGGELEARQGGFEAFLGALDGRVVFGGVRVELVEQFFELFIGHGMGLSLPRGSDGLFAPLRRFAGAQIRRSTLPTSWTATGMPSGDKPIGNETVGKPVYDHGELNDGSPVVEGSGAVPTRRGRDPCLGFALAKCSEHIIQGKVSSLLGVKQCRRSQRSTLQKSLHSILDINVP